MCHIRRAALVAARHKADSQDDMLTCQKVRVTDPEGTEGFVKLRRCDWLHMERFNIVCSGPASKVNRLFVVSVASTIDVKHVCTEKAAEAGDLVKAWIVGQTPDLSFTPFVS